MPSVLSFDTLWLATGTFITVLPQRFLMRPLVVGMGSNWHRGADKGPTTQKTSPPQQR
jgi:hypothetical protein